MHIFTNFHPPQYFVIISAIIVRLPVKKFRITQLQASLWFHKYFKQSGEQAKWPVSAECNTWCCVCANTFCNSSMMMSNEPTHIKTFRISVHGSWYNSLTWMESVLGQDYDHRFPCWQDFLVLINKCSVLTWKSKSTTNIYFGKPQESF